MVEVENMEKRAVAEGWEGVERAGWRREARVGAMLQRR